MSGARRVVGVIVGLVVAVALVGTAVRVLLIPAYTHALVLAVDAPALAGLSPAETVRIADGVRVYVAGAEAAALPAELPDGRPAFDAKAVAHLDDVRDVLAGALVATVAAALAAGGGLGMLVWRRETATLALALRTAALTLVSLVVSSLLVALVDFQGFFAGFHALFFEAGTWQFAADSLLIRVFPERFWALSGAAWGALLLLLAAACGGLSRAARRRSAPEEA